MFIGGRANYSSIKSAMLAFKKHSELELQVVLGGAALIDKYGDMEKILKKDGFEVASKINMLVEGNGPAAMVKTTGIGMMGLADTFETLRPDFVVVIGDRYEVMAPTIAAAYMNIPVVHTMGGEVTGTIDESIRHAITKFAHVHFPANQESAERIIKMGEEPERVFPVGCPRIDSVRRVLEQNSSVPFDLFENDKGVGPVFDLKGRFLLISQHPVTTEYMDAEFQIEETIKGAVKVGLPIIILWPNADAGTEGISKGIRKFRETHKDVILHAFKNLPMEIYIRLMNNTACLIGNSSSAIREGAYIGTPCVNIGSRQSGRERGNNVIDVSCNSKDIEKAIIRQLEHGKYQSDSIYGDGYAGEKMAQILSTIDVKIQKRIAY